jgi:hypothetical protein
MPQVELRNDQGLALQAANEPSAAVATLRAASALDPARLQSWGNLAVALHASGDLAESVVAGRRAAALAPRDARVRHNLALAYHGLQRAHDAAAEWQRAVDADPELSPALASLGHGAGHAGDLDGARRWYADALAAAAAPGSRFGADVGALRLQLATAVVPTIYASASHARQVRRRYSANLRALLFDDGGGGGGGGGGPLPLRVDAPLTSTGCGALGYYLVYTGHNDVGVRRLLAAVYWRASPGLRYAAPFLRPPAPPPLPLPPPPSRVPAPPSLPLRRRLRVGFLSAFFYHHSVGLLTQGVVVGLAAAPLNATFHVTLVYPVPEDHAPDAVSQRLKEAAHALCQLPSDDLPASQRAVAALELDVLVLAEVRRCAGVVEVGGCVGVLG